MKTNGWPINLEAVEAENKRLRDSNVVLEERLRFANSVADLAIKHREMAEASNAALVEIMEEAIAYGNWPLWAERARAAIAAAKGEDVNYNDNMHLLAVYAADMKTECDRLRASNEKLLHALEMVRDANRDEPHIPPIALATIEAAIAEATEGKVT